MDGHPKLTHVDALDERKNYLSHKWRQKSEIGVYLGALLPSLQHFISALCFYQYIEG